MGSGLAAVAVMALGSPRICQLILPGRAPSVRGVTSEEGRSQPSFSLLSYTA